MQTTRSKNNIPIRLTDERWLHITEEHSEMAGYYFDVLEAVANPQIIYAGKYGELIACIETDPGKYLLVVYKETNSNDGFIVTAFFTKRTQQLEKREIVWKRSI